MDGVNHVFTVAKHGLRLELTVFQFDGDIYVDLYRDGLDEAVMSFNVVDCDAARKVCVGGRESLEFAAGRLFGDRYNTGDTIPYGIRISVDPTIAIEFFRYPS